eukprot:764511-Hanusia_phi.AAC.1
MFPWPAEGPGDPGNDLNHGGSFRSPTCILQTTVTLQPRGRWVYSTRGRGLHSLLVCYDEILIVGIWNLPFQRSNPGLSSLRVLALGNFLRHVR